jgi:hypothetical protein
MKSLYSIILYLQLREVELVVPEKKSKEMLPGV